MSDQEPVEGNSVPGSRDAYHADAARWAPGRGSADALSTRLVWIVATIATGIAMIEAFALVGLAPLKSVVPHTLLVDATSGSAQVLDETGAQAIRPDGALTRSMLTQYVIARESFHTNSISDQYRKVFLWSADQARADYLAVMSADNPDNSLHRYPRSTLVTTRIESVSAIAPNAAMVRFVTERRDQNQGSPQPDYWVAILRYRFSAQPLALADRLVNPLGFQVLQYRRDQETPPARSDSATRPPLLPESSAVASHAQPFPQGGVDQPPISSAPFGGGAIPMPQDPRQPTRMPAPARPPQDDL